MDIPIQNNINIILLYVSRCHCKELWPLVGKFYFYGQWSVLSTIFFLSSQMTTANSCAFFSHSISMVPPQSFRTPLVLISMVLKIIYLKSNCQTYNIAVVSTSKYFREAILWYLICSWLWIHYLLNSSETDNFSECELSVDAEML